MFLSTCVDFSSGLDYWPPDVKRSHILKSSDIPGLFGQGSRTLNIYPNCHQTHQTSKCKGCKIARRLKWSEGSRIKHLYWTRRSRRDQYDSYRAPYKYTLYRVKLSTRQPQSQTRSSSASTRVHLKDCNLLIDGYTR